MLLLDLDHFKAVNDKLGHAGGDELLGAVAGRLLADTREGDLVARLGGDEFAMIAFGADPAEAARAVAAALIARVGAPYDLMTGHAEVGVSVGVALAETTSSREELMSRADQALYDAKRAGRGTYKQCGVAAPLPVRQSLGSSAPVVNWHTIELA